MRDARPRQILQGVQVTREAPSRADLIQVIGACSLLVFAVLAFGAVQKWAVFVLEAGAVLLLLLWVARSLRAGEIAVRNLALLAPASAFLVLALVQLVANRTAYRYATHYGVLLLVAYGCFLVIASNCTLCEGLRRVIALLLTSFGAVYALFAIVQDLSSQGKIYWVHRPPIGWVFGSYVNHAHYAGLMEMLAPFSVVLVAGRFLSGGKRALAAFAAVVMSASVFLSGSRGGMLSMIVEMAFLVAVLSRHSRGRRVIYAFAGLACLVTVFLAISSRGQVLARLGDLNPAERTAILHDVPRMVADRPLLGFGLGTFPVMYPQYRSFYSVYFMNQAHNDYLQVLIEMGLLGFAVALWFLAALYRKGLPLVRGWSVRWHNAVCLAALTGCTGLLVHSFVDFNLQIPANAAMFCFLAGLASTGPWLPPLRELERR